MKFCSQCGAALGDGDAFCLSCGAEQQAQPVQNPVQEQSAKKRKKWPWILVSVALAVVVLIGSAVAFVITRPVFVVGAAALKTGAQLTTPLRDFTNFKNLAQNYKAISESGRGQVQMQFAVQSQDQTASINASTKIDMPAQNMSIGISANIDNQSIYANANLQEDHLVFSAPQFLKSDLCLDLKTIGEDGVGTYFGEMMGLTGEESFDIWSRSSDQGFDKELAAWKETLSIEKDDQIVLPAMPKAKYYRVSWEADSMNALLDKLFDFVGERLSVIGSQEEKLELGEIMKEGKQEAKDWCQDNCIHLRAYRGYLDAFAVGDTDNHVSFLFEGEDSLWERIRIEWVEDGAITQEMIFGITVQDQHLRANVQIEDLRCALEYDDQTGEYSISMTADGETTAHSGEFSCRDVIHLTMNTDFAVADEVMGQINLTFDVGSLADGENPDMPTGEAIDLFDLTEMDLYMLLNPEAILSLQ